MVLKLLPLLLVFITNTAQTPMMPQEPIPLPLTAIAVVESHNGLDTNHKLVKCGRNKGTRAYGRFGEMPLTIIQTVETTKSLAQYSEVLKIPPTEIHLYMDAHPELQYRIAKAIYAKMSKRYHGDLAKIAYSWLYGNISGVSDEEIHNNFHVIKVLNAYAKLLKSQPKVKKLAKIAKKG